MSNEKVFSRTDAENLVRQWNLFYNRTVAYSFDHPVVQETIPKVHEAFSVLLAGQNPLSLLFQEFGYYIGYVDLVYQPNNRRVADHLRRFGLESISITAPLSLHDLSFFLDACTLTHANPASFVSYLVSNHVSSFSVNDVSLQTVKEGEVVTHHGNVGSGGSASGMSGISGTYDISPQKSSFEEMAMRIALGHITAQELNANLNLLQVLENPMALPQAVLENSANAKPGDEPIAIKQALNNVMRTFKTSAEQGDMAIEDLLAGMYNMRGEMLRAIKAQQGIAQFLSKPDELVDSANDIFAQTAAQLIVTEHQKSNGNIKKTAQIIKRIVPEKQHMQKVLPLLRTELLKVGVPLIEYYNLISELNTFLNADESYLEFLHAGQSIGVSPDELLKELNQNPKQAAQLIILASEVRRVQNKDGSEDLIQSLSEYVERVGESMVKQAESAPNETGKLSSLLFQMENAISLELQDKDIPPEAKVMGQQKLRMRMQKNVQDIKTKAALTQLRNEGLTEAEKAQFLLEIFTDEKEIEETLDLLTGGAGGDQVAKEIADQVMSKVRHETQIRREKNNSKDLPAGVYVKAVLDFFIKFEISRSLRYSLPFSTILLSFQGLSEDKASHDAQPDALRGLQNVLIGDLRKCMRDSDFIGYLSFNRFLVVLPMTQAADLTPVLKKYRDHLNRQVALPNGQRIWIRPRCGVASFDKENLNSYPKIYQELVKSWQNDR